MKQKMIASAIALALSLAPLAANAATAPTVDTTGYASIFSDLSTNMTSVATGPVGLGAFGALTVGLIFRVVWKLYNKGAKALG